MTKQKNRNRKAYDRMDVHYRVHPWAEKGKCFYCGLQSNAVDHVPPISWAYALGTDWMYEHGAPFLKVPCCNHCNSKLGEKRLFTLRQRKGYIAAYLREKFSKQRESEPFSIDEINELKGWLKGYVRGRSDFRLLIERMIDFAESGV